MLGQRNFTERWMREPRTVSKINSGMEAVKSLVEKHPGASVLDVGCFHGYAYNWLKRYCTAPFQYTGIDMNSAAIEYAAQYNPEAAYKVQDLFALSERYDVVLCSRVLIHVDDWRRALKKLVEASRRAVVIVVRLGGDGSVQRDGVLFRTFDPSTLFAEATRLGCRCEQSTSTGKHRALILYRSAT